MTAILNITDGTSANTIGLLRGPVWLSKWNPTIAKQKSGGIYVDSPVTDGRDLVVKVKENAVERIDIKVTGATHDEAARTLSSLFSLLEKASNYWVTKGRLGAHVYIETKSSKATNIQYATIINASVPGISSLFEHPFLQAGCQALHDNVTLIIERGDWHDVPPGQSTALSTNNVTFEHNLLNDGLFELGALPDWTIGASITETIVDNDDANTDSLAGIHALNLSSGAGAWAGAHQDVPNLDGSSYTITARVKVISGDARLVAYDYGGTLNAVTDASAAGSDWQTLSVTKTPASGGIRVAIEVDAGDEARFGNVLLTRTTGQVLLGATQPRVVSNGRFVNGLTHIRAYDSTLAGFEDRLDASTLPYGLWQEGSSPSTGDIIYFGSITGAITETRESMVGSPFGALAFNIETGALPVGVELLSNTDFESGTTGWTLSSMVRSSGSAHGGTWKIDSSTTTGSKITLTSFQAITAAQATFKIWARPGTDADTLNSLLSSWTMELYMRIHWYDSGSTLLSTDSKTINQATQWGSSGTDVSYKEFALVGDTPAGATKCKVEVELFLSTVPIFSIGGFYMDDFSLREVGTSYEVVWEGYDGASWVSLPDVVDGTNGLQNEGIGVVQWTPDTSVMNRVAIDGLTGYWVRLRLTAISGGSLRNAEVSNFHPYVPNMPCVEIPATELGGDLPPDLLIKVVDAAPAPILTHFDDAAAEDADVTSTVIDTTSTTVSVVILTTEVGVRFTSVDVPQYAEILDARLEMTPDSTAGPSTDYVIRIYGEDAGNAAAWTTATDFNSRARTTEYTDYTLNEDYWSFNSGYRVGGANITDVIQEIVDRTDFSSGNAINLILDNGQLSGGGDTVTFDSTDGEARAWALSVTYIVNTGVKSTIFAGARQTSRGENFHPYIQMMPHLQPFIEVGARFTDSWESRIPHNHMAARGDEVAGNFVDGLYHAAEATIHAPLAQDYSGTFRAFVRVNGSFGDKWRLHYRAGSYSGTVYSRTKLSAQGIDLIDFGLISIPVIDEFDTINIAIDSDTTGVEILDFVLIPADEWIGEFRSSALTLDGGIVSGSVLEIGDMDSATARPRAILRDATTDNRIGEYIALSTRPRVEQGETVRIWFLTATDKTLGGSLEETDTNRKSATPASTHASLPEHCLLVSTEARKRYSAVRGDR